jgi:hypothetical protein
MANVVPYHIFDLDVAKMHDKLTSRGLDETRSCQKSGKEEAGARC